MIKNLITVVNQLKLEDLKLLIINSQHNQIATVYFSQKLNPPIKCFFLNYVLLNNAIGSY